MITPDRLKLFVISNQITERQLDRLEADLSLDLDRKADEPVPGPEAEYYLQFDAAIRSDAAEMARHYEVFYSLERSIRTLIEEKLEAELGANWWDTAVSDPVKQNVKRNIQREIEHAVTPRSAKEIDYTTFGELGDLVRQNWAVFADTFNDPKAFSKVMTSLNVLRGPIAHCGVLAPDEVVRLHLTVKDWYRLME